MTIIIEEETDISFDFDYKKVIEDVINKAMEYKSCPYEAEVGVVLTDNKSIQASNKEFRGIDSPTDVLSFPMVEYEEAGQFDFLEERDDCFNPESGELLLGDIVISVEKVIEQADKYNHSTKRELAFLTAHSMLHLFGYDHMTPEDEKEMSACQEDILSELGITRGNNGMNELINKAKEAMENAYAPYSGFKVGAAILTADGRIYTGCNVENSSYGAAICAERTAAVKAVSEGAVSFKALAIVCSSGEYAYPCGICRQFVGEFMDKDGILYLEDDKEGMMAIPFFETIPYFFTGDRIK